MEIPLKNSGKITLIDDEDFLLVSGYTWNLNMGYVRAPYKLQHTGKYGLVSMHRIIMNCPKGLTVDHINNNKLDNRKCNLRICKHSENVRNRPKQKGNFTSKFKGVSLRPDGRKWLAHITFNNKIMAIGTFEDEIEAAMAYNEAAKRLHGEFARLNVI